MASRRPPLFELLQHDDTPRQGQGSGPGRPNVLGHEADQPAPPNTPANGHAQGALETKPSTQQDSPSKGTTLENLSETAPAPQQQPKARSRPAHKPGPTPKPKPVAAEPKAQRPAGAADWSGMHPKGTVQVRMIWLYTSLAAVIALVFIVWGGGYKLGVRNEKAELERYLNRINLPGPISDPMLAGMVEEAASPPPLAEIHRPDPAIQVEQAPRIDPQPPVVAPEPARTINVLVDVREAGNNYLKLASGMTLERARGLAEHLTTNGFQAMAIDEGRQGFGIYTAFAVPSGQYRTMGSQRHDHEARVVRLLGMTPEEAGGPYTPRDPLWMRFDG